MLNENEKKILQEIKKNPYISQLEIADKLELSRSGIAGLISKLLKEGYILGRAYVLNDQKNKQIVCIGGANIDQKWLLHQDLQLHTSNPASSESSSGGVVRNVAENLGRLGQPVTLLAVLGQDAHGEQLIDYSSEFMDMSRVTQLEDETTGTYQAVLQPDGDMVVGLANMAIMERMDVQWVKESEAILKGARFIVADNNLPQETVSYLVDFSQKEGKILILIGVSAPKTKRLPAKLEGTALALFNKDEAQAYFQTDEEDVVVLASMWIDVGCKQAVVTDSVHGVGYADHTGERKLIPVEKAPYVVDVTGAGDSFAAGVIYGLSQDKDLEEAVQYGLTNSYYTVQTVESVRHELTEELLKKEKEERF